MIIVFKLKDVESKFMRSVPLYNFNYSFINKYSRGVGLTAEDLNNGTITLKSPDSVNFLLSQGITPIKVII